MYLKTVFISRLSTQVTLPYRQHSLYKIRDICPLFIITLFHSYVANTIDLCKVKRNKTLILAGFIIIPSTSQLAATLKQKCVTETF
jgi:hypothetical protein